MFAQLMYNGQKRKIMKTKQIMKIEYTEPLMKVKEMRRRRCVVAQSNDSYIVDDGVTLTQDDQTDW